MPAEWPQGYSAGTGEPTLPWCCDRQEGGIVTSSCVTRGRTGRTPDAATELYEELVACGPSTQRGRFELTVARTHYTFLPKSAATTQLIRDRNKTIELSMDDDGEFLNQWLATRAEAQPRDAAVGYALAVAFGTGAHGFFSALTHFSDIIPG